MAVWLHDNAFCGLPLIARGFEAMFWEQLLAWADRHAGAAAFLHLPGIPEGCMPDRALAELSHDAGRKADVVERELRAQLASDLTAEDYFNEALTNKKRKELRRQARRLAEIGALSVERVETPEAIAPWADAFLALEAASKAGDNAKGLAALDEMLAICGPHERPELLSMKEAIQNRDVDAAGGTHAADAREKDQRHMTAMAALAAASESGDNRRALAAIDELLAMCPPHEREQLLSAREAL